MNTRFLTALFAFSTFCSVSAFAGGYDAGYNVYAGGFHVLQARLSDTEKTGGRYTIAIDGRTYGFLDKLVPWRARLETTGAQANGRRLPLSHLADTTTRDKHEINRYRYDPKGELKSFSQTVNGKDETRKDIGPEIHAGTIDVLTAVFRAADLVAANGGCGSSAMIFDSERSYRLTFHSGKPHMLAKSKYNIYAGKAVSCTFDVTPVGGKWHKKPRGWMKIQEQAKKSGVPPTVWFASVSPSASAAAVPVKALIKTDHGAFVAHLVSYQDTNAKPVR